MELYYSEKTLSSKKNLSDEVTDMKYKSSLNFSSVHGGGRIYRWEILKSARALEERAG